MTAAIDKKQLRNVLTNLAPQAKDLLVEMIKYPSTSGNEADVQTYLAQKWEEAGFKDRGDADNCFWTGKNRRCPHNFRKNQPAGHGDCGGDSDTVH